MNEADMEPLVGYDETLGAETLHGKAEEFLALARRRRSIRSFAERPVPRSVIETCLAVAGTAPSGANQQPWHFVAVSCPRVKQAIRMAAEREEQEFYRRRAPQAWLDALAPIGTDAEKPFLVVAPWLIAIFAETYGQTAASTPTKHYYVNESVGIATGMLISALNYCGLATLTHTPSPMHFLNSILDRPQNEKPFLLLVVGFPQKDCRVPKLTKKPLEAISSFICPAAPVDPDREPI